MAESGWKVSVFYMRTERQYHWGLYAPGEHRPRDTGLAYSDLEARRTAERVWIQLNGG